MIKANARYGPVAPPRKEQRACDECGKPASVELRITPGRVLIAEVDHGGVAFLCDKHGEMDGKQPAHCSKVFFLWPDPPIAPRPPRPYEIK
jgi:hypothetical protein